MPARIPDLQSNHTNGFIDEIVISGISGRLPESNNLEEFKQQLFDGVDLITDDERRWPSGLYTLPTRTGKLKEINKFDATFFGVHAKQSSVMDPQLRMLLELTFEAIVDSGANPNDLKGSKTGVFIGVSESESADFWTRDPDTINGYSLTGCCRAMFANRISYAFDFNGPSFALDTACSSSLVAMQQAIISMKTGQCDSAIVGGVNLLLKPTNSLQFHRLGMLSPEGACKAFDASGNGYVRSEAAVVIFLQKASNASRIYATILGSKVNTDGYKEQGITFPIGNMQNKLIRETFQECGVDPLDVSYVEAHGTGTKVGDPQEVNSIAEFFCKNRKEPLLIGSVKSNMGHSESASGLCSIAKIVIAMESGIIPANLHFQTPNKEIPALVDGRLKVVSKNQPWNGGIMAVNSFGFGGANAHIILKSNPKPKSTWPRDALPRIVGVSGRSIEAVNCFLDHIEEHKDDDEFLALVNQIHKQHIYGHLYRGFSILKDTPIRATNETSNEKRPIWFIYSGMGSQWAGMGKELLQIEVFKNSIKKSTDVLKPYKINLEYILTEAQENDFDNILNSFVSIASIQVALTDVLKSLGITPDGIVGHSVGEIGCAYADGGLTAEQAVLAAYSRGKAILESDLIEGKMAAVGLTAEDAKAKCPSGIYVACHNSKDNVTISGPSESVTKFVNELTSKDIFAKAVKSSGIAFHSKYIADAGPKLRKALDEIIKNPKPRSSRWISTSIPESAWGTPLAQQNSSAYHVNNLLSPVLFDEALKFVPENAIAIEIAPTGLLQAILKRSLGPQVTNISLMKRQSESNVDFFTSAIGGIFNAGGQPQFGNLYPPVCFPVGKGTPMISSMMKWDHSTEWPVANFFDKSSRSGELTIEIDLSKESDEFLTGHTIDGRILFPATGYLTLVWKTLAKLKNADFEQLPVVIEKITFHRATIMPKKGSVKFLVNIFEGSGEFEVCENGSVVCSGRIYVPEDISKEMLDLPKLTDTSDKNLLPLLTDDIYKELRLRGYDYDGIFQGVVEADNKGINGKLKWNNNWISYIDTMLQFSLISNSKRDLYLPTQMQKLLINPKEHLQQINGLSNISVHLHKNISLVKSGGIEVRGMKASLAPRRQQVQASPKLEKYQFVPFENNISHSENEDKAKTNALTIISQLVLENSCGAIKLKIAEMVNKRPIESALVPSLKKILESEPKTTVDAIVIMPEPVDVSNFTGTAIIKKETITNDMEKKMHLVVVANILNNENHKLLDTYTNLLTQGGFILSEEPKGAINLNILKSRFDVVGTQVTINKSYVLLRKPVEINLDDPVIRISNENLSWLETVKHAMKKAEINQQKIYLYAENENIAGLVGLVNCLKQEPGGTGIRSIFITDNKAPNFSIKEYSTQLRKDLVHNVLKKNTWGSYHHLLLAHDSKEGTLQVEHAYINTLTRGDLASLRWIEGPLSYYKGNDPSYELCHINYATLNFRDVMLATGKLSADAIPGNFTGQDCILGFEFAGRDSQGKRVMGMVLSKALATSVLGDRTFLWEVPEKWSLEEASTIPVVYATSYYALLMRGRMRPGESILIHAGSGGVGQASITIALQMHCKVFTTVGSQAKREFLKKRFPQLSDDCIGNSRDTSFEQMIMNQTNGKGVDLVLNSLAGEQLQASVRCLAYGGRFLEIGKFDLSNDSPLGMSVFLRNTEFHGILLDGLICSNTPEKDEVSRLLSEGIKNGTVKPLPSTVFNENQVEEAFRFMASGKHIGKIVLKICDEDTSKKSLPKTTTVKAIPRSYMNPDKTYILVGGLGGFGLELTNWLIVRGATKIVLNSRSGIKTGYQSLCVIRWRELGAKILISTADATTEEGARKLLQEGNSLGPVGGIFNLAAVLRDAMMENQHETDYKVVCRPKIDATKQLDLVSRTEAPHLDYFVCFSSISCGRGNIGQSNYGFANSVMERICETRQECGLPGLAIQWGAIGDVGLILETIGNNDTEVGGTLPQKIASCLATMDIFLQQPNAVVASMVLSEAKKPSSDESQISLINAIANILGIKDTTNINKSTSLADLGMDSLMGAEIKQTLERNYDVVLNAQEIRGLNFQKLSELENKTGSDAEIPKNHPEEPKQISENNEIMPSKSLIQMKVNENSTKSPMFIIHPIEGVVSCLQDLAENIDAPVYGLQCTKNTPLTSIQDLSQYYITQIKTIQPKGPYSLIGYSFGACVAFEMGIQLEKNGEHVNLILIDGSPEYVATHTGKTVSTKKIRGNTAAEQAEALVFFTLQFKEIDQQKITAELVSLKSWEERVSSIAQNLSNSTPYSSEDLKAAASSFYHKLVAADKYKPTSQFQGSVTLFKASDNFVQLSDDYGLSEVCKSPVKVHPVEGNHKSILNGKSLKKIATMLHAKVTTT